MRKICLLLIFTLFIGACSLKIDSAPEKMGIINTKKTEYQIPDINIPVSGGQKDKLTTQMLNELDKYEIKANVDNNFEIKNSQYIGIKIADVLDIIAPEKYYWAWINKDNEKSRYAHIDTLTENTYLIFINEKESSTNKIYIANFDEKNYNWIDIETLLFVSEGI